MAIKSRDEMVKRGIEIDLNGPQGNAYYLMGTAKDLARQMGKDGEAIVKRMMSGDYENLLSVIEEEFGDVITLFR